MVLSCFRSQLDGALGLWGDVLMVSSAVSVPPAESLLRMKEEPAEVDEFTFSQGASDQESNGSGSYYIKQEH